MNENLDLKVSVEEMQSLLNHQFASVDAFKGIARSLLAAASLIVGLIGALQLARPQLNAASVNSYNSLLVAAMVLYGLLIICCVWVISPVLLHGPVYPSFPILKETYIGKGEREILEMRLAALLNALTKNSRVLLRLNWLVTGASILLPAVVILLLLLSTIPQVP